MAPRHALRVACSTLIGFGLALIALPALATTIQADPGVSHLFTDLGMDWVDKIVNDGLAFAGGPLAIIGGIYGIHKTAQGLHDADSTHDYSRKGLFGGVATAVASGGIGVAAFLNQKARQSAASTGIDLTGLHHSLAHAIPLVHHLVR